MTARVKLCAIAKNEGAYLADWVFHHLHFGFEAVEVWVNATEDPSLRILKRISAKFPQVTGRRSDRLLAECLAEGKVFQHRAYARMARRARCEGFTHAAFLDLDEYWTPRDFTSPIGLFVPGESDVNVVSFLWAVDVPDPAREPFLPPFAGPVRVQLDRHVKSVVRLDDSVRRFHAHTGRTTRGTRLLARAPFPVVDLDAQAGGSFVTDDHLVARWNYLPEAFVLHAINRSAPEYVGSLAKGMRQTGSGMRLKSNRLGFVPTTAPILDLEPSTRLLRAYGRRRQKFLRTVNVARATRRSEALLTARGDALIAATAKDHVQMAELRSSLRGIPAPTLDAAYPGWDTRVVWWVDGAQPRGDRATIAGWAFSTPNKVPLEFALRSPDGAEWNDLVVDTTQRPDVRDEHPEAPPDCGFEIEVPQTFPADLEQAQILVRIATSPTWEVAPFSTGRSWIRA